VSRCSGLPVPSRHVPRAQARRPASGPGGASLPSPRHSQACQGSGPVRPRRPSGRPCPAARGNPLRAEQRRWRAAGTHETWHPCLQRGLRRQRHHLSSRQPCTQPHEQSGCEVRGGNASGQYSRWFYKATYPGNRARRASTVASCLDGHVSDRSASTENTHSGLR